LFLPPQAALYIPHGSDESLYILKTPALRPQLYIPHGSDERRRRMRYQEGGDKGFISHMVQMKENLERR